ncbi:Ankyrin-3 (ANK-3) (Ankyrin-G) [Durusdinium trenchii]|uniref:Ankyrin-3 (ANK-3) (Ankyrin-G) n=1 Tax=Durusdinium trenchii TaxID=1381693 RepID=A0ABP0RBZ1_9DINO
MDELVPGAGKQQDALREACEEGQINSVDILLKQRADPNHADESGSSLLRQGCDKGHLELVRLLLHFRADPGFIDSSGRSPLYCACYKGHLELVSILLRQRADPNVSNTRSSSALPWGTQRTSSESRWWTPLTRTCQEGLLEMARLLLTWQADPNRIDRNGLAPLRCACDQGHSELVQLLLDRLADPCIMDDSGLSPFFCVCDRGTLKLAALLLRQHADPNVGDKSGRSPLAWAIENDRLEIAEALLAQKVNPNVIDHLGRTPLTLAQKTGEWNSFLQGLQQALETPPTLTPLLLQALRLQENTPNLTPLLLRALADPNYSSIKEHPLKLAIEKSRVDLVKQYLENRADPNVIPTVPLVHYKWNSEILQLLMEHRAEPNLSTVLEVTTIKVQDRDGGDRCDWTSRGIRPDGSVHITCSPGYLERTLRHLVELNADTSLVLRKEQRAEVLEVLRALRTVRVYCAKSGKLLLQTWAEEVRAPGELFVLIHNGLDGLEDMRPHAYRLALHPVQMERELLMHFLETSATCFAWKFDLLPMSSHFLQAIISNQHLMNLVGETDVNVWLNLEVVSNNEYLQELLTSASAGDVNAVRWVLERGQRPDETLQDEYVNGYTALHVAAEDYFREVAQVLLEKQADANQTEPNEMCTPLHLAAQCGHAWMVELLLRHGANRAAVDFEGQRAVDLAEEEEEHAAEEGDEVKANRLRAVIDLLQM